MRVLLRVILAVLVVYSCQLARCDVGEHPEELVDEPRIAEDPVEKKDGVRSGKAVCTLLPRVQSCELCVSSEGTGSRPSLFART